MTEEFDPSPRTSKRRRLTTYHEGAPTNEEIAERSSPHSDNITRRSLAQRSSRGQVPVRELSKVTAAPEELSKNSSHRDAVQHDEHSPHPRSSGRERKKPRRYSASPEPDGAKKTPRTATTPRRDKIVQNTRKKETVTPKSILTPSKRYKNGSSKTVAFESKSKNIEEQLGFRDIDNSDRTSRPHPSESLETPTGERGKIDNVSSTGVQGDTIEVGFERSDQELVDVEPIFDQILEIQRWDAEPLSETSGFEVLTPDTDPDMADIKKEILSQLSSPSSKSSAIPNHLQTQYESIHNLLTSTITSGESNSLLILGSRGSGKSQILDVALKSMRNTHGDDFHVVHLNGFFQTDDKVALREIWRQLGREMNIAEEQVESTGSYADTMASLLSLLSHPDDYLDDTSSATLSKSVVVILDEFDLFTTHPRQTLLYNLFDIAQSRKAPIAVIGFSTRMDVVECLEKRVKSRFSHRWVHLPSVKSLDGFEEILRNALLADEDVKSGVKGSKLKRLDATNKWNKYMKTTFLQSTWVQNSLKRVFYTTKSIPDLFATLYPAIARLQLSALEDAQTGSPKGTNTHNTPHLVDVLQSLPTLHLSLLVAASRLDTIHNLAALNFNLVYDHYAELISRTKLRQTASGAVAVGAGLRRWTVDIASEAWEDLGEWHLIVPATASSGFAGKDAATAHSAGGEGANVRMWKVDVTLDDLTWALRKKADAGGTAAGAVELLDKWCREI